MKVLHVIDQLTVGGAEVLTINVVNLLAKESDIDVHLCVTRKEGPLKDNLSNEINYVFLEKKKTFDIGFYKKLQKYIATHNIDIVHAHNTSYFSCALIKVLFHRKLKLVWHNHTGAYVNLKGMKLSVLKFFSNFFNVIVNVNFDLNEWSKTKLKANQNLVLNNFASFNNWEKTTNLKGTSGKRFVCLAGLRPVKDHPNLINAFENVIKKHPEWTLHLIGKSYEDDYADLVAQMISNKKLENNVFLYGLRQDVRNILDQSTIGLIVSKKEGLPISLLEYGLARLPVIVTDVGNNKDLVQDDRAVVSSGNPTELSNCMIQMINNEELRDDISKILHQKVTDSYSGESFISHLKDVYLAI